MTAGRHIGPPQNNGTDSRVAIGRPATAGSITFEAAAEQLIDNGYDPLPIIPGEKRPAPQRWSSVVLNPDCIADWVARYPGYGVGLRTGRLVGLDIDELDPDRAHEVYSLAEMRFGATLVRVGQWPKRMLLYRADVPFAKLKSGKVEFLAAGQQFVAFGGHKLTGRPYQWVTGETPLEVCLDDLPPIDEEGAAAFLAEIGSGAPSRGFARPGKRQMGTSVSMGPVRGASGLVVDGRDSWLSQIAFHMVHDAIDAGEGLSAEVLADRVWERFASSTDLSRGKHDGPAFYLCLDALHKVQDKLRLAQDNRLPSRATEMPEPDFAPPTLSVEEGRQKLDSLLKVFCSEVVAWCGETEHPAPALGIRATVGLGKSRAARAHLLPFANHLKSRSLPHRILIFTASHALAEETASAWAQDGAEVAVMRGYERIDGPTGEPMCKDIELVRAAIMAGANVQQTVCADREGATCRFFGICLKQQNRREVAAADVVVAPYDALYSGLALNPDDVALLLVDEGCWARAARKDADMVLEDLLTERVSDVGNGIGRGPHGSMADLVLARSKLVSALAANGSGSLKRAALNDADLSVEDCRNAARLERWRSWEARLVPGISGEARRQALSVATSNERIGKLARLWDALAQFLAETDGQSGRMRISAPDAQGRHRIELRDLLRLHPALKGKPVLHLDATLRPELAKTIFPALSAENVEVMAPHMRVRHVHGSFGKSMLCPSAGLADDEAQRRKNRLSECVDYVRWHARRVAPGRVLVVTYKAIEDAFAGIENVNVAHFNAVAGLDCYKDVALLISIGRPLPPSTELEALAGTVFGHVPEGSYRRMRTGITMRSGISRSIEVLSHENVKAETLRAAICDDELVQVVGRGRGVGRGEGNPLEVHVLSDVALPLVYDLVQSWDAVKPDVMQQMLLAGVAVDSPADAAALYPGGFPSANQAKKLFDRCELFKGQNPIYSSYREMTLKSAAYRRAGRGRGWQRAWWIEAPQEITRAELEERLGPLAGWDPC